MALVPLFNRGNFTLKLKKNRWASTVPSTLAGDLHPHAFLP